MKVGKTASSTCYKIYEILIIHWLNSKIKFECVHSTLNLIFNKIKENLLDLCL